VQQLSAEIEEELKAALGRAGLGELYAALEREVAAGRLTPRGAARRLVGEMVRAPSGGTAKP
jgi:hypothetical protein